MMAPPSRRAGRPSRTSTRAGTASRPASASRSCASSASAARGVNAVNRMIEAEVTGVEFIARQHRRAVAAAVGRARDAADRRRHRRAGWAPAPTPISAARPRWRTTTASRRCSRAPTWCSSPPARAAAPARAPRPSSRAIARELGALTVGIVTKPFGFEGSRRLQAAEKGIEALRRGGRHAHRRAEQPAAVGARQADVDGRGLPGRRRRAAPGRPGHLGPDHAPGPDQPRLRRRAHDHVRRRQRAARHRHGHGREAGGRRRRAGRRPRRCWRRRSRARARSCCRSPAAATSRCGRSTRPRRRSRRPPTPRRTSSSARCSTRSSRTRSGSPSSRPATATRRPPRREAERGCPASREPRGEPRVRAPANRRALVADRRRRARVHPALLTRLAEGSWRG